MKKIGRWGFTMENTLVIGIAGGTGSGKTTLMKNIVGRFGENIAVISHDNYYKRHDELPYEERCKLNYDEPAAFDTELLVPSTARCTTLLFTTAATRSSTLSRKMSSSSRAS